MGKYPLSPEEKKRLKQHPHIVEGLSEGFEKGLGTGVEKAFDKMWSFLDDLFK